MSVSISSNNNVHQMISYCAPLAGGALGIALYILFMIGSDALTIGVVNILDFFGVLIFLSLSNYGMPRQLIVDNDKQTITLVTYSLLKSKRVSFKKSIVTDIGKDYVGVIYTKHGGLYVFNLWGYFLAPKKHMAALNAMKSIW